MWKKKLYYVVCLLLLVLSYIAHTYVLYVRIRRNYVSTDPEITFPIKILIKTAVCAETSC